MSASWAKSRVFGPASDLGVGLTTNKYHVTDAELICLRRSYKSPADQAQTLARLNNQKPDEVVERYLSTATAILLADAVRQIESDE